MSNVFDTSSEQISSKDDPSIERLVNLAEVMLNHEELVKDLEVNLNEAKSLLNKIKTIEMPDLMAEVGISEFKHSVSGAKIRIEDFVAGSLPKEPEKKQAAIEELTRANAVDLIKTVVTLTFDKKQHNEALSIVAELRERGYEPEVSNGVHPQTLMAFGRECLRNGINISLELLGLYAGKTTKVTWPKGKRQ